MNATRRLAPKTMTPVRTIRRPLGALTLAAALAAIGAAPASALDLTTIKGIGGPGWATKSSTPELVQLTCAAPTCPPSGQLAIASRPAPDAARDEVIDDPKGALAGYRKGFEKSSVAQACTFDNFRAEKIGETGARIQMDGDCPSGLVVMMATIFDKSQSGSISVVASSQDRAKADMLRQQTLSALDGAIAAPR